MSVCVRVGVCFVVFIQLVFEVRLGYCSYLMSSRGNLGCRWNGEFLDNYKHIECCLDGCMNGWMNVWMNEWMDVWMNERINEWCLSVCISELSTPSTERLLQHLCITLTCRDQGWASCHRMSHHREKCFWGWTQKMVTDERMSKVLNTIL